MENYTNVENTNEEFVEEKKVGKVYAFWSPQVGSGCTFILYNFAKTLASQGKKVLMLDYDLRTPTLTKMLNTKDTLHYLDNLLPYAEVDNISQNIFDSHVQKIDENLFFIAGNNNPDQAIDIGMKGLETIIATAKEQYDFVLIDTNAYVDNAGTYSALYDADQVYMLIEKKIQSIHTIDYVKNIVSNMFGKFILVINKVDKNILLSTSEVERYFAKDTSFEIANLGVAYINEENIGRGEQFLNENKRAKIFKDSLNNLIKNTVNVEVNSTAQKKGLFGRKKGGK